MVEGEYRADSKTGLLCVPVLRSGMTVKSLKPRIRRVFEPIEPNITYSRFCQYLIEVSLFAGVLVLRSQNVQETAEIIKALWANFQTPPSQHQSLKMFYSPSDHPMLLKPGLVRRVAKEFNEIGWQRSGDVAQHFSSVREMANAEVEEWESIEGIGKKIAENVVRQITGLEREQASLSGRLG
jgi:ERCC4-type nuclease